MKRILLVEDDALLNKTLAYNLISDGWVHGGEGNWLSVQGGGLLREVQEQPAVVVEILCRFVVLQHGEHGADLVGASGRRAADGLRFILAVPADAVFRQAAVPIYQRPVPCEKSVSSRRLNKI